MPNFEKIFERNFQLLGKENMQKIKNSKVAIIGLGGVGSVAAEALARTGFSHLSLIDMDRVDISNINRQRQATIESIGQAKTSSLAKLLKSINPEIKLELKNQCLSNSNMQKLITTELDYIIDAIDMMSAKIDLITYAKERNIKIISSMGTANKLDPTLLTYADIYQTTVDPIAKILRRELKKRSIDSLDVVYSTEKPRLTNSATLASLCFVPNACGLALAAYVTQQIIAEN